MNTLAPNPLRPAQFVLAAHQLAQLPADQGAEVAFAGRSNAGKSSALNAIVGQAGLARTSKTPGRTQQLVVFEVEPGRRLIDLPGYGYAKVPADLREHWRGTLDSYFRIRESLKGLVLIMDSRHPLKEFDRQMLKFAGAIDLPTHCLLTKADKLSRGEAARTLLAVERELAGSAVSASAQLFSSPHKSGVDAARGVIGAWLGFA